MSRDGSQQQPGGRGRTLKYVVGVETGGTSTWVQMGQHRNDTPLSSAWSDRKHRKGQNAWGESDWPCGAGVETGQAVSCRKQHAAGRSKAGEGQRGK